MNVEISVEIIGSVIDLLRRACVLPGIRCEAEALINRLVDASELLEPTSLASANSCAYPGGLIDVHVTRGGDVIERVMLRSTPHIGEIVVGNLARHFVSEVEHFPTHVVVITGHTAIRHAPTGR